MAAAMLDTEVEELLLAKQKWPLKGWMQHKLSEIQIQQYEELLEDDIDECRRVLRVPRTPQTKCASNNTLSDPDATAGVPENTVKF